MTENKFDKPLNNPDVIFLSKCHPAARGRLPKKGESEWVFQFETEVGSIVAIRIGRVGRDAFKAMLEQEEADDCAERLLG